jgi:hypothetical protein
MGKQNGNLEMIMHGEFQKYKLLIKKGIVQYWPLKKNRKPPSLGVPKMYMRVKAHYMGLNLDTFMTYAKSIHYYAKTRQICLDL